MDTPDPQALRRAFINSSRSRAASATLPAPWPPQDAADRDFLGWVDPKAPQRAYLVVGPGTFDELTSIELRLPSSSAGRGRRTMCDLCQSSESPDGAALVVAPRAGSRGRQGDSVGICVCVDFGCSGRARRPLKPHEQSLTGMPDLRVEELVERLTAFVDKVRS